MMEFLKRLLGQRPSEPERRRALRVAAPPNSANVSLDGASYPIKNWSMYGFLAGGYAGPLVVGDTCRVSVDIRQEPFVIAFATEVVIMRREGSDMAGRFVSLPTESKSLIDAYFSFHSRVA